MANPSLSLACDWRKFRTETANQKLKAQFDGKNKTIAWGWISNRISVREFGKLLYFWAYRKEMRQNHFHIEDLRVFGFLRVFVHTLKPRCEILRTFSKMFVS